MGAREAPSPELPLLLRTKAMLWTTAAVKINLLLLLLRGAQIGRQSPGPAADMIPTLTLILAGQKGTQCLARQPHIARG